MIGVVVPAWNEARRLPRLLAALAACRPAPGDVVVADGGSEDGTREIAAREARLVEAPRGRASQQNAGAAEVGGEVLWFLHADSVPPPGATREIAAAIGDGAPGGAFLVGFPPEERARDRRLRVVERGINARTRWTRTATGDQGIFVRRDVFEAAGGFPDWPLFEDVALWTALRKAGRPEICTGPMTTSGRRWLDEGVVRTTLRMWALRVGYLAGVPPSRLARWWRQGPR